MVSILVCCAHGTPLEPAFFWEWIGRGAVAWMVPILLCFLWQVGVAAKENVDLPGGWYFRALPLTFRKVATSRLFFCELVSDIEVRCNMKQHALLLWNPALVV